MGTDEGSCGCGPSGKSGSNPSNGKFAATWGGDAVPEPVSISVSQPLRLAGHRFSTDTVNEMARFVSARQPAAGRASVAIDTDNARRQVDVGLSAGEVPLQGSRARLVDAGTLERQLLNSSLDSPGTVRVERPGVLRDVAPLNGVDRPQTGVQRIEPSIVLIENGPVLRPTDGRSGEAATTYLSRSLIGGGPLAGTTLGQLGLLSERAEEEEPEKPEVGDSRPDDAGPNTGLGRPSGENNGAHPGYTYIDSDGKARDFDTTENIRLTIKCKTGVAKVRYTVPFSVDIVYQVFSLADKDDEMGSGSAQVIAQGQGIADGVDENQLHKKLCEWAVSQLPARTRHKVPSSQDDGSEITGPDAAIDGEFACNQDDCDPGICEKRWSLECLITVTAGPKWYLRKKGNEGGMSTFELMVFVAGQVTFEWTIKCVCKELEPSPANLPFEEQVRVGYMSPAGQPLGKANPPGTTPVEEDVPPDDCCCIIHGIWIDDLRARKVPFDQFGHSFDVYIRYWFKNQTPEGDCQLRWHEYASHVPQWLKAKGYADGTWVDGYAVNMNGSTFRGWRTRKKEKCFLDAPALEEMSIARLTDTPALAWHETRDRHLWIKVVAKNGCDELEKSVCVYQYLNGADRTGWAQKIVGTECEDLSVASGDTRWPIVPAVQGGAAPAGSVPVN